MKTIRLSITQRKEEIARSTFSDYVSALRRLYVFDDLEAWRPSLRAKTRVCAYRRPDGVYVVPISCLAP